ncbi:glutathione synthetase [Nitzschia inconspicua]|uniref:Glutathione synthetase n=1 Tax=Nitzschia inconspicua TaxID=303405 RepID=A0A9K3KZR5_9STRA|nr:glutathione synthetase [Nitzschia inconspicua]
MFHQTRLTKSVFNLYINSLLPLVIFFVHQTTATFAWTTINKVQSASAASPPQISTTSTESSIQTIMSDIPLDTLAAHANSYASANGIQVERRRDDDNSSFFECAPMSLLPNAYPKDAFQQAHDLAPAFNELIDRVSRDAAFLQNTLGGGVSTMDPYTGNLLQLYQQVYVNEDTSSKPAKAADRLGIHRTSFAGLSCEIASLHQYLTTRFATETSDWMEANQKIVSPDNNEATTVAVGVPENPALQRIPLAMKTAYDRYAQRFVDTVNKKNLVILFVVQDGETNTVDQRLLEFALWETHGIPVTRRSLTKLHSDLELNQESGAMILRSTGQEVAVVYFRAGYAPTDYPDGDDGIEWHARLLLEQSRAAKCPSLGYHLAGTKKVQQELARPGVLERFYPDDKQKVEAMRLCFAGLYSMGDDATPEDLQAAQNVLDGKEAFYVLKPQREGGSDKDASTLQLGENLAEYILMERLFPPQQRAILLRGGKVEGSGDSVSELGCYGCILVDHEGKVLHNEYAGFLLRTKFSTVDEGGVASGFATLSSPYLC